jgi:hypothetical protein
VLCLLWCCLAGLLVFAGMLWPGRAGRGRVPVARFS